MEEKNNSRDANRTRNLVTLSILTALVILFQVFGSFIKIGATTFNFVLVPVVIGGIALGYKAGAFLGLVSAVCIAVCGLTGFDPFTNVLLANEPFGTLCTVFLKGFCAGIVPPVVFKAFKENDVAGSVVAGALAPILNTGIFICCMLIMSDVMRANFVPDGTTVVYFLVITCAGVNFIVELAINLLLVPVCYKTLKAVGYMGRK